MKNATPKEIIENIESFKLNQDKIIDKNAESLNSCYESNNKIIDNALKECEEARTFEEKKYWHEKAVDESDKKAEKDSENKRFYYAMAVLGAGVVATALTKVLKGEANVKLSNFYDMKGHIKG